MLGVKYETDDSDNQFSGLEDGWRWENPRSGNLLTLYTDQFSNQSSEDASLSVDNNWQNNQRSGREAEPGIP